YGAQIGITTTQIALMMSLVVVAGAVMQIPAGRISDMTDRRYVLAGAALGSALMGLLIFLASPRSAIFVLMMASCYGALAYTLYSIAVAHANDHASPEDFVKVSGGLLLLYGFGTMAGPLLGGFFMQWLKPESLFLATALPHLGIACYAALRISRRAPVPIDEREAFNVLPAERAVTPQALMLDPRSEAEDETMREPA
ncbi:MAG TPA: MFS transporter, partial [Rhizobiaceae bacterium]|nr:MFS transporter [Rhizobiaceae bacterium]